MPHFPNGSGWGKLGDTVQLEPENSMVASVSLQCWNVQDAWFGKPACMTDPLLTPVPEWAGCSEAEPQLCLPRCFSWVWNPYMTQQVWCLGIENVCIWIPSSLNVYCQFKSGVNRWSPFPCLTELLWSASFLWCWAQICHLSEDCCNHCALSLHIYFCLRWDIKYITLLNWRKRRASLYSQQKIHNKKTQKILYWCEPIFLLKKHCFFSVALELKHQLFRQQRPKAGPSTQCCHSVPRWLSIPCFYF